MQAQPITAQLDAMRAAGVPASLMRQICLCGAGQIAAVVARMLIDQRAARRRRQKEK